ncbi:MAG: sulfate transporter [Massilia sp.]|jgi:nucleotide-binding universal stress UspA family protein|nr:sulfate transporter [Massilia sp.]
MFQRILLPTDGSSLSERAVLAGVALANAFGAGVAGLTVVPEFQTLSLDPEMLEDSAEQFRCGAEARAGRHLDFIATTAQAAGVPCTVERTTSDEPWQAIIDTARARHCDLVVMASHGRRDVRAALLGSETQKVLVHSDIPVLVYR